MNKLTVNEKAQCVGCRQCELICSLKHEDEYAPWLARIRIDRDEFIVKAHPVICMHCPDAPCAAACPVNAITQSGVSGAYQVNQMECIGCFQCREACPFGAIVVNTEKGIAMKCDLCGGKAACVGVCPADVLRQEVR